MTPLKFRVWDYGSDPSKHPKGKILGKMVPVDHLSWGKGDTPAGELSEINGEMLRWFSPVMQSTGLKDKNGKEIFEGDVIAVSYPPDFDPAITFWEGRLIIRWKVGAIGFQGERIGYTDREDGWKGEPWYGWSKESWEVIGNVWQNPDLLPPR